MNTTPGLMRCRGKNKDGQRCLRFVASGKRLCSEHSGQGQSSELLAVGAGALLAVAFVPTAVAAFSGAVAGKVLHWLSSEPSRLPRVFVSFDFDNDQALKHLLIGQTKRGEAPFNIVDSSLKEAAPEHDWKTKARAAIKQSDLVVVLIGRETYRAPGVLAEVTMARAENVKIVQLYLKDNTKFRRLDGTGNSFLWTHENLAKLFSKQ